MAIFSVTLSIDGRPVETKPFEAFNKQDAIRKAEEKAKRDFPKAEEVDAVNVECLS